MLLGRPASALLGSFLSGKDIILVVDEAMRTGKEFNAISSFN